jgi:hypothetical protein
VRPGHAYVSASAGAGFQTVKSPAQGNIELTVGRLVRESLGGPQTPQGLTHRATQQVHDLKPPSIRLKRK